MFHLLNTNLKNLDKPNLVKSKNMIKILIKFNFG